MEQHAQMMQQNEYGEEPITSNEDVNDILQDLQSQHNPQMEVGNSILNNIPNSKSGNLDNIMDIVKNPVAVSCLYVLLNLRFFDDLMIKYLGSFLGESGSSSIKGVIFKALLLGVLYYLTSQFIL